MKTIFIVEDEPQIQEMLAFFLESEGFSVVGVIDFTQALSYIASKKPVDLILLDWMLPNGSGLQLLKKLKQDSETAKIPVIMLTARSELDDKIAGLNTGADDYIAKPFSLKELGARIQAVLRRATNQRAFAQILDLEGITVDMDAHRLYIDQQIIDISRIEFKLLTFLITHPEKVYSRAQLLDHVWGMDCYIDERTVDVSIGRLRKILEPTGHHTFLQTVRGSGYRFSTLGA
jgi:two-component system phosphate regulon response regulator PhoB